MLWIACCVVCVVDLTSQPLSVGQTVTVKVSNGKSFEARVRLDTPVELTYFRYCADVPCTVLGSPLHWTCLTCVVCRLCFVWDCSHGGILPYVLRKLVSK